MLTIRLTRVGKKNYPAYRVVVTQKTAPVKGKYLEKLGHYNPNTKELFVNKEKVTKWLNVGAAPSNTVAKLLKQQGIEHKLIVVKTFKPAPSKQKEEKDKKSPPQTNPATGEVDQKQEISNQDVDDAQIKSPEKEPEQPKQ